MKNFSAFRPLLCLPFLLAAHFVLAQTPTFVITGSQVLCPGECGELIIEGNGSISPNYQFQWSNGEVGQVITVCQPGGYSVTVSGPGGYMSVLTAYVQLAPYIEITITPNQLAPCNDSLPPGGAVCQKVCPNTTVVYSAAVLGSSQPVYAQWQVSGNQKNQTLQGGKLEVTWGTPGKGIVGADGVNQFGCYSTEEICVQVIEPPKAKIETQPAHQNGKLTICKGQTVYFENKSANADLFEWNFGNGSQSSDAAPEMVFKNAGTFKIQLFAHSSCLCSDTTTLEIEVLDSPAPDLDCVGTICPGETVTYTASGDCAGYAWSVSPNGQVVGGGAAGSKEITVKWLDGAGKGQILLEGIQCTGAKCPVKALVKIPIVNDFAEIEGKANVCPGSAEAYQIENFSGTNFVWKLSGGGKIDGGQGSNKVVVEWSNNADYYKTYWLSVTYDNCYLGCSGSDSIPVRITPTFFLNGPVEFCADGIADFSSQNSYGGPILCNWTMKNPTGAVVWQSTAPVQLPKIPFTSGTGSFQIFAKPADPSLVCIDQSEWAVQVRPRPAAPSSILGETQICPSKIYSYEAAGLTGKPPLEWTWQNGSGTPMKQFGNPINLIWGSHPNRSLAVQTVSQDGLGCKSDPVNLQVADFPDFQIVGKPALCRDEVAKYEIVGAPEADFEWEILPSTAGTFVKTNKGMAVEVFWNTAGGHTLIAKFCSKVADQNVQVFALPDPKIQHPTGVCPGATATVQTSQVFQNYVWKNSNSAVVGTGIQPQLPAGTFALEVTDHNGCKGTGEFTMDSLPLPNLTVTTPDPTGFCNNSRTVKMHALVTADGDYTFDWFKDGASLGVNASTYSTNQYGIFSAQVTNQFGCIAKAGDIRIFEFCGGGVCHNPNQCEPCPAGAVEMDIAATATCDHFNFQNISGALYQPGTAYWKFGESGSTYLGQKFGDAVDFTFDNAGWYIVALYANLTNGKLCLDLDSVKVKVKAGFKVEEKCPGDTTKFKDISTFVPDENIASWAWDFGDPATGADNFSTSQHPEHRYFFSGKYTVSLTVTAASGCTSTFKQDIEIPEIPNISAATLPQNCERTAVEFSVVGTSSNITSWLWNFGDPSSGTSNSAASEQAFHTFQTTGNYPTSVVATNVFGCKSTANQSVQVAKNTLSGNISVVPAKVCDGFNSTLTAPTGGTIFKWSNGATTPQISTGKEGVFNVTITDSNNCIYTPPPAPLDVQPLPEGLPKAILKNDLGQIIGTAYPNLTVCEGEDVFIGAITASTNVSVKWSTGSSALGLEFSKIRGNQLPAGTHIFNFVITDKQTGCTQASQPLTVVVNPRPAQFSISSSTFPPCSNSPNVLKINTAPLPNLKYEWNTGETTTTITTALPGKYSLRAANQFGCTRESNPLTVLTGPRLDAVPDGCHARCRPDTLCLPSQLGIVQYQWFMNGVAAAGATTPKLVATESGSYVLKMTDASGCVGTSPPLEIELFDGYGSIFGKVWADVNSNGQIDAADTLVGGVQLLLKDGAALVASTSSAAGNFAFANFFSKNYQVEIAPNSLPAGWEIVEGLKTVQLSGCDDNEVVAFLIKFKTCLPVSKKVDLQACSGTTVDFAGEQILAGESKIFNFKTVGGCDSTVVVEVAALENFSKNVKLEACVGTTVNFGGEQILAGESKIFNFKTVGGCDSTVVVEVAALENFSKNVKLEACSGTTVNFGGEQILAGESKIFKFKTVGGCDSTVVVEVAALENFSKNVKLEACVGTTVNYGGEQILAGESKIFNFKTVGGCDSTVVVQVEALQNFSKKIDLQACVGTTVNFAGEQILAGNTKIFNFKTVGGCDSTVVVQVEALQNFSKKIDLQACVGTTVNFAGEQILAGESKIFNFKTVGGCDSTVEVQVEALQNFSKNVKLEACVGTTVNFAGEQILAGNTKIFNFKTVGGCDSTVEVQVEALQNFSKNVKLKTCAGTSANFNGEQIAAGATKIFNLKSVGGCDSVVTVAVEAIPLDSAARTVRVCPGLDFEFAGEKLAAGTSKTFHFLGSEGCDSTVLISVKEYPEVKFQCTGKPSCPGKPTGEVSVRQIVGYAPPLLFSLDGKSFQPDSTFLGLPEGQFTVFVQDSNHCVFEQTLSIGKRSPLVVFLDDLAILPCAGGGTRLEPQVFGDLTNLQIGWSDGSTDSKKEIFEPKKLKFSATNDCETVEQEVAVIWSDSLNLDDIVYLPNVFSPSAERPENASFRAYPRSDAEVLEFKMRIFDRWGEQIFVSDSPEKGWTGFFRTAEGLKPAVFVYFMEMRVRVCGQVFEVRRRGDVTLVK